MKLTQSVVLFILVVTFSVAPATAGPDPIGETDSVKFVATADWAVLSDADTLSPPIELWAWTDAALSAASMGFKSGFDYKPLDPDGRARWGLYLDVMDTIDMNPLNLWQTSVDSFIWVDTFIYDDGLSIPTMTLSTCVLDTTNDPAAAGADGSGHFNGLLLGLIAQIFPEDTLLPLESWTKIGDLYLKINLDPGIERIVPSEFDIVIDSVFYPWNGYFKFNPKGEEDSFQPDYDSCVLHVVASSPWDADEQNADVITPQSYQLTQNYPNPFNPSTTIRFYLSNRGFVDLAVYNILGRKVTTLVKSDMDAGWQEVIWDGASSSGDKVASGIYFYRLMSGEFTETKKMLLLK